MKVRRFLLGAFVALLTLVMISAALVASNEQAYANGVPAVIYPAYIQHDIALINQAKTLNVAQPAVVPAQIFSGHATQKAVINAITEFTPQLLPFAASDSNFATTWNSVVQAQSAPNPEVATQTALTTDNVCWAGLCGWNLAEGIGIIIGVGAGCAVLTAVPGTQGFGIICFLTLAAAVTTFYFLNWLGSQINSGELEVFDQGVNELQSFNNATSAIALSVYNAVVAFNNQLGTFAAEAEAAALEQLGGPWNQAQDLNQSTIAGTFGGYELSEFSSIAGLAQDTYNYFAHTLTGNPGCAGEVGYSTAYPDASAFYVARGAGTEGTECGSPVSHGSSPPVTGPILAMQNWDVTACGGSMSSNDWPSTFYVTQGLNDQTIGAYSGDINTTYAVWGSGLVHVYNLTGVLVGTTLAATAEGQVANWTFGTGGFMLCSTDSVTIGLQSSFPMNDPTEAAAVSGNTQTNPEAVAWIGYNPNYDSSITPMTFADIGIVGYGDAGICQGSIYGNGSGNTFDGATCAPAQLGNTNVLENLTYLLYVVAHVASYYGEAYWAFLTYLGFTNADQVPEACLIGTPSALAPPDEGIQFIEYATVFQILLAYVSEIGALNETFNNTGTMPVGGNFTACGLTAPVIVCGNFISGALNQSLAQYLIAANIVPQDPSWWTCSFGLSTQGIGYYDPGGVSANTLAAAREGLFALSPSLSDSAGTIAISGPLAGIGPIPINETWQLPNAGTTGNPATVQIFAFANSTNPYYADPASCLFGAANCTPGIGGTATYTASGNSTERSGSLLGTHTTGVINLATVWLVACEQVNGNSSIFNVSTTITTNGTCDFVSHNWTWAGTYCEAHPAASVCQTGCDPTKANNYCCLVDCQQSGYNYCLSFPIVSLFTVAVGNAFGGIPVVGGGLLGVGQAIGCIVGTLVLVAAGALGAYAIFWVVRHRRS